MSNKIFGQLYFAETVQAEQSGEEDDDTEDDSADTLMENLDLESDDGTLLIYVNILFSIHTYADRLSFYFKKLCVYNSSNVM